MGVFTERLFAVLSALPRVSSEPRTPETVRATMPRRNPSSVALRADLEAMRTLSRVR